MRFLRILMIACAGSAGLLAAGAASAATPCQNAVVIRDANGATQNLSTFNFGGANHYCDVLMGVTAGGAVDPIKTDGNGGFDHLPLPAGAALEAGHLATIDAALASVKADLDALAASPPLTVAQATSLNLATASGQAAENGKLDTLHADLAAQLVQLQTEVASLNQALTAIQAVQGNTAAVHGDLGQLHSDNGVQGAGYTPPTGGAGVVGFLSGIYHALTGTLSVAVGNWPSIFGSSGLMPDGVTQQPIQLDANKNLKSVIQGRGPATEAQTSVNVSAATSTLLIAANPTRRSLAIIPTGSTCKLQANGGAATLNSMPAPGGWNWTELDPPPGSAIYAYCASADTIAIVEGN